MIRIMGFYGFAFKKKLSNIKLYACVCYLPHINSSRQINVPEFYEICYVVSTHIKMKVYCIFVEILTAALGIVMIILWE
jgi:hypothetical protein